MIEDMVLDIMKGIQAGGIEAIRQARLTNTKLIVWLDGKIVEVTPDEAENMLRDEEMKVTK